MKKFNYKIRLLAVPALIFLIWGTSQAQDLTAVSGRVLLIISGKIEHSNSQRNGQPVAEFDQSMLEDIGLTSMRTSTIWTDGVKEFAGPLARDVLAMVGAKGSNVVATALNDYKVTIPVSDFENYPVLLALSMDGQKLSRRDKGPMWIVYPRDEYPELASPETNTKWIWQLKELVVE